VPSWTKIMAKEEVNMQSQTITRAFLTLILLSSAERKVEEQRYRLRSSYRNGKFCAEWPAKDR
jgi:predicted amino acid-binding ACT domain protein